MRFGSSCIREWIADQNRLQHIPPITYRCAPSQAMGCFSEPSRNRLKSDLNFVSDEDHGVARMTQEVRQESDSSCH